MTELPTPTASRLRAPSWRDSRLLVGVLLVVVSTVLGALVVGRADHRVPVWAAAHAVTPGQRLTPDDLTVVRVQLGDAASGYVAADAPLPDDAYALRDVRPGELLPRTALGGAGAVGVQQVALQVEATSAGALRRGSLVDVYVNRPEEGTGGVGTARYAGPELALERVGVASVADEDSVLAGAEQTRPVQVMVPSDAVRDLVDAVDDGARITLVPVPGGAS